MARVTVVESVALVPAVIGTVTITLSADEAYGLKELLYAGVTMQTVRSLGLADLSESLTKAGVYSKQGSYFEWAQYGILDSNSTR